MDEGMIKDRELGSWIFFFSFYEEIQYFLDNRENVLKRLKLICRFLDRKLIMKEYYFTFM